MGSGGTKSPPKVLPEQKWDYITLNDFKATSYFSPFAYAYLFVMLGISVVVYCVDTFTAVNLIAFDQGLALYQDDSIITFDVAKWIFTACIMLSFANLGYEHIRAYNIMKRGSVAECFLDNLAARVESIRIGSGQGYRRFLVFTELAKSKKGAEYIALFVYFNFQTWFRVLLCAGPRQVVNAFTLVAFVQAEIDIEGDNLESSLLNVFHKIRLLADSDYQQALVLSGMVFTLCVWVFSFLTLLISTLFYVFFLAAYIHKCHDGSLRAFCERKVNKRLMQIVSTKINKAMAEQERQRKKAAVKAAEKAGRKHKSLYPTLPDVEASLPTLPLYRSRAGTPAPFELNHLGQKGPMPPSRTGTPASTVAGAYSLRSPLLNHAAEPGISRAVSRMPPLQPLNTTSVSPPPPRGHSSSHSYRGVTSPSGYSSSEYSPSPVRSSPSMLDSAMPLMRAPVPIHPPSHVQSNFRGMTASPAPTPTFPPSNSAYSPLGNHNHNPSWGGGLPYLADKPPPPRSLAATPMSVSTPTTARSFTPMAPQHFGSVASSVSGPPTSGSRTPAPRDPRFPRAMGSMRR